MEEDTYNKAIWEELRIESLTKFSPSFLSLSHEAFFLFPQKKKKKKYLDEDMVYISDIYYFGGILSQWNNIKFSLALFIFESNLMYTSNLVKDR